MKMTLLISMVVAVLYVGAAICRIKTFPDSISAMVYAFRFKWLWTIMIWLVAFLLAPCLIEALGEPWQFLGFLSVASLLFCGAMPLFDKENNTLHNIFGISAGILSQMCVAVISPWWLMLWLLWVGVFVWQTAERSYGEWRWSVFLAESICYASMAGSLY